MRIEEGDQRLMSDNSLQADELNAKTAMKLIIDTEQLSNFDSLLQNVVR